MKLFKVDIELSVFVVAESDSEAERLVEDDMSLILRNESADIVSAEEIRDQKELPKEWDNSIAYGNNEHEMTCGEVLASIAALGKEDHG